MNDATSRNKPDSLSLSPLRSSFTLFAGQREEGNEAKAPEKFRDGDGDGLVWKKVDPLSLSGDSGWRDIQP